MFSLVVVSSAQGGKGCEIGVDGKNVSWLFSSMQIHKSRLSRCEMAALKPYTGSDVIVYPPNRIIVLLFFNLNFCLIHWHSIFSRRNFYFFIKISPQDIFQYKGEGEKNSIATFSCSSFLLNWWVWKAENSLEGEFSFMRKSHVMSFEHLLLARTLFLSLENTFPFHTLPLSDVLDTSPACRTHSDFRKSKHNMFSWLFRDSAHPPLGFLSSFFCWSFFSCVRFGRLNFPFAWKSAQKFPLQHFFLSSFVVPKFSFCVFTEDFSPRWGENIQRKQISVCLSACLPCDLL